MRIAIAIGDPNGIGPEIAVKSAVSAGNEVECVLVGDKVVLDDVVARHGAGRVVQRSERSVLAVDEYVPGRVSAAAGAATVAYIEHAIGMARRGEADAVLSCPCSETAVNMAGIPFAGFQPLVAQLTDTPRREVFMMLVADGLCISHVTLHESVASALGRLTPELVTDAVRATHRSLCALGLERPRIALFGINPHAGENGLFGDDDERHTKPAVARLQVEGIDVTGPHPADLVLGQRRHDAYVAIFHDQGHIPIKLLSPLRATSLTIGVPVTFASVAHGAAHDIAGQGTANPSAMAQAIAFLSESFQRRHA